MKSITTTLTLIGNTPLLELSNIESGVCKVFAKLEVFNPTFSIKDRIAVEMIEKAEQEGRLKPGGLIVEATAGNTGISLALIAKLKGYKLCCVVPDHMSQSKIDYLKSLDVDVQLIDLTKHGDEPKAFLKLAKEIAEDKEGYYIGQFENENNWLAHYKQTGPELLSDLPSIDAFVVGCGTAGTLKGVGQYLKDNKPGVNVILADPEGSVLANAFDECNKVTSDKWISEGVGSKFIPKFYTPNLIDEAYTFSIKDSQDAAKILWDSNGIKVGMSSAAVFSVALKYAKQQTTSKNIVFLICDSAERYK